MLNKWRRLFHSSRVKIAFVNMSASWCWVSTYLIRIFGSRLILSNNQARATLWVLDTCLIVGLLPLMIILITAFVILKDVQHRTKSKKNFAFERHTVNIVQIKIVVMNWYLGLVLGVLVWCGVTRRVSSHLDFFWFSLIGLEKNETLH